jgi:aryl-alcohol dehydrogenase-like predicted oxidoreductase
MKKIQLSQTGVDVSCMSLGTLRFGTLNTYAESARLMDAYVEAGGRFFDSANSYNQWSKGGKGNESEIAIGRWLRERGNRDELFIATKVGFGYGEVPDGLAASTIISECEASLRRLGIDYIDLYYIHKDDPNTPLEETMGAMNQLVHDGKVRFIGASNYRAWRLADADAVCDKHGWAQLTCVEQRFTYLRPNQGADLGPQRILDKDMMSYCDARGRTMLAYTTLLRGAYVRDDRPLSLAYAGPDADARLKVLHEVAQETGATVNQIVLAWMMHRHPPIIPVISASDPDHLRENMAAADVVLSAGQMHRLDHAGYCPHEEPN